MSLINREDLIAEYDRVHVGAPGGARKLMEDAPTVEWVSTLRLLCQTKSKILRELRCGYEGRRTGMTLYEMLDCTKYYQEVWIFEHNAYDQNMPLFKGEVQNARGNTDRVWDYLMCQVDHYDCTTGILVILVKNEYYDEHLEGHYMISDRWGRDRNERPWLHFAEIYDDLKGVQDGQT